jgi:hypothetical protein
MKDIYSYARLHRTKTNMEERPMEIAAVSGMGTTHIA